MLFQSSARAAAVIAEMVKNDRLEMDLLNMAILSNLYETASHTERSEIPEVWI